jgi:hypothetical protein
LLDIETYDINSYTPVLFAAIEQSNKLETLNLGGIIFVAVCFENVVFV